MIHAGVSSEFVESEAVDPKEMLHPWYQTNVKMIVEAIPPGLVRERERGGGEEREQGRERERRERERGREREIIAAAP